MKIVISCSSNCIVMCSVPFKNCLIIFIFCFKCIFEEANITLQYLPQLLYMNVCVK